MSTNTTNYNFVKQDENEFYDVNVVNQNLDKIDENIALVDEKVNQHLAQSNPEAHRAKNIGVPKIANIEPNNLENTLERLAGAVYLMTSHENGSAFCWTDITANTNGLWEIFIIGNPNATGNMLYRAINAGYVTINHHYDTVNQKGVYKIAYTETLSVPSAFGALFNIGAEFSDDTEILSEVDENVASSFSVRLRVDGFLVGHEGADMTLLARKVL